MWTVVAILFGLLGTGLAILALRHQEYLQSQITHDAERIDALRKMIWRMQERELDRQAGEDVKATAEFDRELRRRIERERAERN